MYQRNFETGRSPALSTCWQAPGSWSVPFATRFAIFAARWRLFTRNWLEMQNWRKTKTFGRLEFLWKPSAKWPLWSFGSRGSLNWMNWTSRVLLKSYALSSNRRCAIQGLLLVGI